MSLHLDREAPSHTTTTLRNLAELVRFHRLTHDLTLEALAEKSSVSARTISDIERGVSSAPHARTMAALTDAMGLTVDEREELLRAALSRRRLRGASRRMSAGTPRRVLDFAGHEEAIAKLLTFLGDLEGPALVTAMPYGIGQRAESVSLALESVTEVEIIGDYDDTAQPPTSISVLAKDGAGKEQIDIALQRIATRMENDGPENHAAMKTMTMLVVCTYL